MAALLFKMGMLTLKTVAKPLASRFEAYVMSHPVARRTVIDLAQALHRAEVRINRGAEGKTGRAFVGAMSEEKSVELASKVASEGFIYGVGVILLVVELRRNNLNDQKKKAAEAAEKEAIRQLHERHLAAEQMMREEVRSMTRQLRRVDERLDFMERKMGWRRGWLWG